MDAFHSSERVQLAVEAEDCEEGYEALNEYFGFSAAGVERTDEGGVHFDMTYSEAL